MKNCVEEMFYKLERWLKDPTFATYGNKRNTFSSWFDPVIYDYIFHRSNADDVEVWTNWFEMPLLKFLFEKKELSYSDHEAVTSTIHVWRKK